MSWQDKSNVLIIADANPFVAATDETMATYLFAKYDGSIVKFTGTTGTYTNNTLYQVYAVNQSNYAFRELQQMLHDNMPIGSNDTFDVKNYKTVTVAVPSEGLKGAISKASFLSFEEVPQNPTGTSDSIIVVNDEIYILKEE